MEISVLLGFLSHKLIFFLILFSPIVESPFFWFPYWQVKIKQLKLCCKDFLKKQKVNEDYSFVILDDDSFDIKNKFPDRLVLVDRYYGLSTRDTDKAKEILERKV